MPKKEKIRTISWVNHPFPHAIIDNFLEIELFQNLNLELKQTDHTLQKQYSDQIQSKAIYRNTTLRENALNLIQRMSSEEIKNMFSYQFKDVPLLSMGETPDYSGYSPFHITNSQGILGSHIDHSHIQNNNYLHVANSIFYASEKWEKGWGGETVLYSRNGLFPEVFIEPIPNRLILFVHTANSFHGTKRYEPSINISRKTFYHDYYVKNEHKDKILNYLNYGRKNKFKYSKHLTTFLPFLPNGLRSFSLKETISRGNFKYIPSYIVYLINRKFGTKYNSFRDLPLVKFAFKTLLK